jgi:hypothetical protein
VVVEEQGGHAVPAGRDHPIVVGLDVVVGGGVGDRLVDQVGVEADLGEEVPCDLGPVRAPTLLVERAAGDLVPAVEVVHARAPQQRADAQQ